MYMSYTDVAEICELFGIYLLKVERDDGFGISGPEIKE